MTTLSHRRLADQNPLPIMSPDDSTVTLPASLFKQIVGALHFYGHGHNSDRIVLRRSGSDDRVACREANPAWIADRLVSNDVALYREDGTRAREVTALLAEQLGDQYHVIAESPSSTT
ncbi:hypothetical protein [Paraburkholderia humisilvae]|uniref:Uncharacterized protein n=2 Tax=Paraburkholderia humisilvae TaxID=627669 RepID=A0A6J5DK58_9BURK|nr:hypothetical protein [Paraburkholderia humisilvae]CAB3754468.1 hypothetical protein LMG29542_02360 [Paraburkholderia humisilvae]